MNFLNRVNRSVETELQVHWLMYSLHNVYTQVLCIKTQEWALFLRSSSSIRKIQGNRYIWSILGVYRPCLGTYETTLEHVSKETPNRVLWLVGWGKKESNSLSRRQKESCPLSRVCWPLLIEILQLNGCPHWQAWLARNQSVTTLWTWHAQKVSCALWKRATCWSWDEREEGNVIHVLVREWRAGAHVDLISQYRLQARESKVQSTADLVSSSQLA